MPTERDTERDHDAPQPQGDSPNKSKDLPAGKDFGADDDTPQQGGM